MQKMLTGIQSIQRSIIRSVLFKIFVLIVLCYVCYGQALNGSFVFDDTVAIKQNKAIIQLPTNYTAIFTSDFWGSKITDDDSHKSYRPLTSLMFHWEWIKWKLEPRHMKTINLLLHTINTILVYVLLKRLDSTNFDCDNVAFAASILFAVHPVHTEAVSGIVSRADLMFCFIYIICLTMSASHHNREEGWNLPIFIVILTCIGVLFKETAITIPLACVTIKYGLDHLYKLPRLELIKKLCSKTNLLYAFSTIAIITARLWLANFKSPEFRAADNPVAHATNFAIRLFSQNYLYAYNIYILINPIDLCFDWSFDCIQLVESLYDYRLLSVLSLYITITFMLLNCKRNPSALLALGLIVVPFLPASGIIKVGFVIAERVLYVPSVGFCYLVSHGFIMLCNHYQKYRQIFEIGFCVTLLVFILRCRQRSMEWLTEEKLFVSALDVCGNNAKVHYNIARLASDVKNNAKAFHHYHKAIELAPDYDAALMNLGNLYREVGKLNNAENYIKKSLEVTPDFATAWMNLGIVQSGLKHYEMAFESYKNALKYRRNYANCYYNMGNLFLEQKLYTEALKYWQHSVAINPHFVKAWTNMLTMLDSKGLHEDAIRTSEQALKYLPIENSILFLRANVFGKQGRYVKAEDLYKQIVVKEPMNYLYHTNLAVLYHRWNRINDAIESYKKAINANGQMAITARDNLSKLIKRLAKNNN